MLRSSALCALLFSSGFACAQTNVVVTGAGRSGTTVIVEATINPNGGTINVDEVEWEGGGQSGSDKIDEEYVGWVSFATWQLTIPLWATKVRVRHSNGVSEWFNITTSPL